MSAPWTWAVRDRPTLRERVRLSPSGCLILGPAGIGKTTLARQTIEQSDQRSIVVRGIEGLASVPFAALSAAKAEHSPVSDEDDDVVRRLRTWLSELARDGVWVVIDDADALDPPSSGLLSYTAQTEDLHLLVTMRSGNHLPSDLERLALHQSWTTVALEPWTVAEVHEALETTLVGSVAPQLAHAVHELSGGIPLVARELVFDGIAAERIRLVGDLWDGLPAVASPESAARLIGRRLPTSGPPLEVLQMLAIAGQLRPELLDHLAPMDVLVELDAQGLLEFPTGSSIPYVRLAHPMVADALRSRLDAGERRRRLTTLVAAAQDLSHPDELDVLQAMHWAIEVGQDLPLADLREGSALALRHMDYALAADIAGELQRRHPSAQAAFFHAVALARAARFDEAVTIADEARPLAATDDEVIALARILVRLHSPFGTTLGYQQGRPDHAAAVADWADDRMGNQAFHRLLEMYTVFVEGELARSLELATEVVELDSDGTGIREEADDFLVMAASLCGRFDLARASQSRFATRPHGSLHLPALMGSQGARVSLLMYDGRLRDALEADEAAFAVAQRTLAYDEMMNASAQQGIRSYLLGDLDRAVEALELSLQYRVVPSSRSLLIHGLLAASHARRDEPELALRVLDVAELERGSFSLALLHLDYDHLSTYALAAAGALEPDAAETRLRAIADEAAAFGYHWLHTLTRLTLVRLGFARPSDGDALASTVATVDASLIRAAASTVIAAAERDPERLLALADDLAAMEAHNFEVDAIAAALALAGAERDRSDADPDTGTRADHQLALIRRRLDRAVASCRSLVVPPTIARAPERHDRGPRSAELTVREAEISRLAADGLASKVIAERLGLSPRTVDNTLRRVYTKLGVSGRRDLAAVLGR